MTLSRRHLLAAAGAGAAAVAVGTAAPAAANPLTSTDPRLVHRLRPPNQSRIAVSVARPTAQDERLRLHKFLSSTDLQPTGQYLPAGVAVTARLVVGKDVALVVGAPATHPDAAYATPREYPLTPGENVVTDPGGGMLYLKAVGDGRKAVVHFGPSTVLAPQFLLGRTTEEEFQTQLDTRTDSPQVELVSPYAFVTVTRQSLLAHREQDHGQLLDLLEQIITSHADISGLSGHSGLHGRGPVPFHLVESPRMPTGAGAYAAHGFTAYPAGYMDRLLTTEGLHDRGWGVWHELGHQHQQLCYRPVDFNEVTVNIYSLAVQRRWNLQSNLVKPDAEGRTLYDTAFTKMDEPATVFPASYSVMERLVMMRQFELAFGEDFWPRLHRLAREENPQTDWDDAVTRLRYLMVYTSRIAGRDLRGFFGAWRLAVDAETHAALDVLALPDGDIAALREG
ncbi:M60 family metallopeptidase [Phytomonospora sp. NPDC050363]|uniref:M60 family metallopeptidase n=1 Tax=Phytomonospora sp. NPDC050363 TaxID=3155642 RepID=UPI00340998B0